MPRTTSRRLVQAITTWCAAICLASLPLAMLPSRAMAADEAVVAPTSGVEANDESSVPVVDEQPATSAYQQDTAEATAESDNEAVLADEVESPAEVIDDTSFVVDSQEIEAPEEGELPDEEEPPESELIGSSETQDVTVPSSLPLSQPQESLDTTPGKDDGAVDPSKNGWVKELDENGLAFRYYEKGVIHTGWLVTDTNPITHAKGLDRYWLDANGILAINRLIDPATDGAGAWYAFSTASGNVVRGKYISDTGRVYLADDAGRLAAGGWLVSSAFGDGLQRYFVDAAAHAAVPGYATADYAFYTRPEGFVVRGKYLASDGTVYLAKNNGRLEDDGWLVSNKYGDGTQRYYIDGSVHACVPGYSTDGWAHYTNKAGYVLRGASSEDGQMRIADNDGMLIEGWVVVDAFGHGFQRYWQQDGQVVRDMLVRTGSGTWAFARPEGYVVRGKYVTSDGRVYLANNDGRLASPGWLVTTAYDPDIQRYYIESETHAAQTGFFSVDGKGYFGMLGLGFVARPGNSAINANNDGVLRYAKGWLVTDAFGQGLQRYWVQGGTPVTNRLISNKTAGYWAFARPEGYVVRGKWLDSATGNVYLANNDGALENTGWLITSAYDGVMRRYYVNSKTHAATIGLFTVKGNVYLGREGVGYVLTGSDKDVKGYVANNDGVLYPTITATVPTLQKGVTTTQVSTVADKKIYLFLPSFADLTKVVVSASLPTGSVDMGLAAKGSTEYTTASEVVLFEEGVPRASNGAYLFDVKAGTSKVVQTLAVMVSANISSLFVTSADPVAHGISYINESPNHSTSADASVLVVDANGGIIYNKDAENGEYSTIKGRGNTSWVSTSKKGYQIKLSKKEDLLVTGDKNNKAKKWILIANASDPTLMRNSLALRYGDELGIVSEEFAPVDLYYDGAYRGSYLLLEKVEIGKGRLEIDDLEESFEKANSGTDLAELPVAQATNSHGHTFTYIVGAKNPESYSGGYLLELDPIYYKDEAMWFATSRGYVVVKSPEFCSFEAMLYISEYVQRGFDAFEIGSSDGADFDSYARLLLLNEFTKNVDFYYSSTYFYKDSGKTLESGPAWDFDSSCGVRKVGATSDGFIVSQNASFISRNLTYLASMSKLWKECGESIAIKLLDGLKDEEALLSPSQAMNQVIWGFEKRSNCIQPEDTYGANVDHLITWLRERIAWFSSEMNKY